MVGGYPRVVYHMTCTHTEEPRGVDKTPVQPCHGEVDASPSVSPRVWRPLKGWGNEFAIQDKIIKFIYRGLVGGPPPIFFPGLQDGIEIT